MGELRLSGTRFRTLVAVMMGATGLLGCGDSATQNPAAKVPVRSDAAALWVNSRLDQVDADPGDGHCASVEGHCTLRAAIMEANASGFNANGERHTILLPPGIYPLTLANALSTGDLGLGEVLARPIIDSESTGSLNMDVPMTIHGAGARDTIVDGQQLDRVFELSPGADGTLTDLTVTGGDGNTMGGGIYAQAHLRLERVHITGNRSSGGGGIFVNPLGNLTMNDSTVSYNIANGQAGGIRIDTRGTITNSTISHNQALGLTEPLPTGTGVPFAFAQGGGIDIRGIGTVIRNSTIVFNQAAVAQGDCLSTVGLSRILSQGHNLDSDGSCGLDQPGDLQGMDPMLSELAAHQGPTDTHALKNGSPARGAGNPATCTARDQRGVDRSRDGACDIGAFES